MTGERMGEMIWRGIVAKARDWLAECWPIVFAAVCTVLAFWIGVFG